MDGSILGGRGVIPCLLPGLHFERIMQHLLKQCNIHRIVACTVTARDPSHSNCRNRPKWTHSFYVPPPLDTRPLSPDRFHNRERAVVREPLRLHLSHRLRFEGGGATAILRHLGLRRGDGGPVGADPIPLPELKTQPASASPVTTRGPRPVWQDRGAGGAQTIQLCH